MTLSRFRDRRGDRHAAEDPFHPADWDATTIAWLGASGTGLPDEDPTVADLRQAIEITALADRGQPRDRPLRVNAGEHDDDKIARDMTRGWPRLFEVRCAYPAAAHPTPIPCGATHRDDTALTFRGLRQSAQAAGWHLDALGRWACPDCCQDNPAYRTLYPLTQWDAGAAQAALAGDVHAEFWLRAVAEHKLFRDVRDAARHGRHQAGAR